MKLIKNKSVLMTIAMFMFGTWAGFSFAGSEPDTSAARIERLEAAVSVLERRVSALERPSTQSESPKFKATGDWKNKSNWRLLSKGMTKEQVRGILGEPEKIDASGPIENWRWKYPLGPSVTFYDDVVYGWDEK